MSNEQPAEAETAAAKAETSDGTVKNQEKLVGLLRDRAKRLRRTGWIVLATIVIVIAVGSVAFWLSGQRSQLQELAEQGDRIKFSLEALRSAEDSFSRLDALTLSAKITNLHVLSALEAKESDGDLRKECKEAITESNNALAYQIRSPADAAKHAEIAITAKTNAEEHLATLTELMRKNEGWSALVITSSRLAIAVLLLFLVQFLVIIYRYIVRLSSFYDSRADVLMLGTYSASKLVAILSPDSLEFGKSPKAPYESVAELTKLAAQSKGGEK